MLFTYSIRAILPVRYQWIEALNIFSAVIVHRDVLWMLLFDDKCGANEVGARLFDM